MRDPALADMVTEVTPHPRGQHRLFRVRCARDGTRHLLKVGLSDLEAVWMPEMSRRSVDVVAHVRAHGEALGGLDLGWLLMEDLPHRARSDSAGTARAVMRAAARFQQEAQYIDLPSYPIDVDFLLTYGQLGVEAHCPGRAADVVRRVETDYAWLHSLGDQVVGHGDVHFWNTVSASPDGPWRLIDPIPRTAHWAWDAAYAQMTSGVAETPDLVELLAEERGRLGLPVPGVDQLPMLRMILLAWSSLLWWAILPGRCDDAWWASQIHHHLDVLAIADHNGANSSQRAGQHGGDDGNDE